MQNRQPQKTDKKRGKKTLNKIVFLDILSLEKLTSIIDG
jgi:hypothetical protein